MCLYYLYFCDALAIHIHSILVVARRRVFYNMLCFLVYMHVRIYVGVACQIQTQQVSVSASA